MGLALQRSPPAVHGSMGGPKRQRRDYLPWDSGLGWNVETKEGTVKRSSREGIEGPDQGLDVTCVVVEVERDAQVPSSPRNDLVTAPIRGSCALQGHNCRVSGRISNEATPFRHDADHGSTVSGNGAASGESGSRLDGGANRSWWRRPLSRCSRLRSRWSSRDGQCLSSRDRAGTKKVLGGEFRTK